MACLKGLIELVLTHVRLTLQVDVLFYANEIAASIFVRIEVEQPHRQPHPFPHPSGSTRRQPTTKTCADISFSHSILPRSSF